MRQLNTIDADLLGVVTQLPGALQQSLLGAASVMQAVLEVLNLQSDNSGKMVENVPLDHNRFVLEFVQGLLNELA